MKSDYITVQALAKIAFTANKTVAYVNESIQFTDQSTGDEISAWSWAFGDGQTSTDQHPVHAYSANGTYDVTLNVTNVAGTNSSTKLDYITVNVIPVPTVAFTANTTTVYPNETIRFTDTSTSAFPMYT